MIVDFLLLKNYTNHNSEKIQKILVDCSNNWFTKENPFYSKKTNTITDSCHITLFNEKTEYVSLVYNTSNQIYINLPALHRPIKIKTTQQKNKHTNITSVWPYKYIQSPFLLPPTEKWFAACLFNFYFIEKTKETCQQLGISNISAVVSSIPMPSIPPIGSLLTSHTNTGSDEYEMIATIIKRYPHLFKYFSQDFLLTQDD